jgi:NAD(P)H dehydrogenase (quinone)
MSIVVTGATGRLGGFAVDALIERGVDPSEIVAGGRKPERLAELAGRGIRTAAIDFEDPQSLRSAFQGAQKLLLVSVRGNARRLPQHRNAIEAAKASGIQLMAYTGYAHADISTMHPEHYQTERLALESGVPAVVLRNPPYFEFRTSWIPTWREQAKILGAAKDGRMSSASVVDLADAAAAILTSEGHEGAVYELGGEVPYTMTEFAAELSGQTGEDIPYVNLSLEEFRASLISAGFHEVVANSLTNVERCMADGELQNDTGDLGRLRGRPSTTLAEAIAHALRSPSSGPSLPPIRPPEQAAR